MTERDNSRTEGVEHTVDADILLFLFADFLRLTLMRLTKKKKKRYVYVCMYVCIPYRVSQLGMSKRSRVDQVALEFFFKSTEIEKIHIRSNFSMNLQEALITYYVCKIKIKDLENDLEAWELGGLQFRKYLKRINDD